MGFINQYLHNPNMISGGEVCRPHKRLDDPELCQLVKDKFLEQQRSPEEIAGRLALEHHTNLVSYTTICRERSMPVDLMLLICRMEIEA
jgi:IS30 family transposase